MPKTNPILNLPGFTIKTVKVSQAVFIEACCHLKVTCPHCKSDKLRKKDSFMRKIKHESIGMRQTVLVVKTHKYHCKSCKAYFNRPFPGVVKYQRATERLKEQIFIQHSQGMSQKDLATNFKLGKATIERWYHQYYARKNQLIKQRDCPRVLGIDEHSFTKKDGMLTTLCDLGKRRVFDVVKGRSESSLAQYLESLPGRDKVQVVCIDLSSSYRSLVKKYFPNAKIVADRFHVIRQINQAAMQTYQSLDKDIKHNRGTLAALRTKPDNLTPKRKAKRDEYLKSQPAVEAIYHFKDQLHKLLMIKHQTKRECKHLLPKFLKMVKQLKESQFKALQTLGKTLYNWREEIVRMWRFTKNNGITEGFHRKMKLIQRRAYGFRSFENYRLRVRVLCG